MAFLFTTSAYFLVPIENRTEAVTKMRLFYVWAILLQNMILLFHVRTFDFWSTFVRSLSQIIIVSLPLAACLGIFIFTQSLMFFVISINDKTDGTSYFQILTDSYRFALGDFAIADTMADTENKIEFWIIFFIGTVVQVLIILNMVIAVMSNAFAEVSATNEANIYKAKLNCMLSYNMKCMRIKGAEFKAFDYLYRIEIDPVITDIGPTLTAELPETSTITQVKNVKNAVVTVKNEIMSVKNSQSWMQGKLIEI